MVRRGCEIALRQADGGCRKSIMLGNRMPTPSLQQAAVPAGAKGGPAGIGGIIDAKPRRGRSGSGSVPLGRGFSGTGIE